MDILPIRHLLLSITSPQGVYSTGFGQPVPQPTVTQPLRQQPPQQYPQQPFTADLLLSVLQQANPAVLQALSQTVNAGSNTNISADNCEGIHCGMYLNSKTDQLQILGCNLYIPCQYIQAIQSACRSQGGLDIRAPNFKKYFALSEPVPDVIPYAFHMYFTDMKRPGAKQMTVDLDQDCARGCYSLPTVQG